MAAKPVVSPRARSRRIPSRITDFGNAVQYTFATDHGSPRSGAEALRTRPAPVPYMATRWAWMWSGCP